MADTDLDNLSQQLPKTKNLAQPPLHLWNPDLSGDIDIQIKCDGRWIHEGRPFTRPALVKLFASILRRESDGEYYLVTPAEKWRVQVECLPLVISDFEQLIADGEPLLRVTLNTGRTLDVDNEHRLYLPDLQNAPGIPAVELEHGLAALFSRAAWYRLAELCEETEAGHGLWSAGKFWPISA
jgi:hypothetical protein